MPYRVVRRREDAAGGDGQDDALFVIEEGLGYLINYLARAFARELAARLAPFGVAPAQWAVLMFLWVEDGLSQTELSRRHAVEEATIVRTVDRMERDGLVRRQRDARDRRRINVLLTERGRALRDELIPVSVALNAWAMRDFGEAERRQLMDLLRRLVAAVGTAPTAAVARAPVDEPA